MIEQTMLMLLVGGLAGFGGVILGLGGGIIVTPVLTLVLGMDIKYAIGASIIAVIATSSGSTIAFLKDDVLNIRVAMFLEIFTTIGALTGAILAGLFNATILFLLFGCLLLFQSWNMFRKLRGSKSEQILTTDDPLALKLRLNSSYYDKQLQKKINYKVEKIPVGALIMFGAGIASGLLGIGSGAFKVMAMDGVMKMPLKPSSSTSNLMMGVTATASTVVYFFNGIINPIVAVPIALGILLGSTIGSHVMQLLPARVIRMIFVPVLLIIGLQLVLKGLGVNI